MTFKKKLSSSITLIFETNYDKTNTMYLLSTSWGGAVIQRCRGRRKSCCPTQKHPASFLLNIYKNLIWLTEGRDSVPTPIAQTWKKWKWICISWKWCSHFLGRVVCAHSCIQWSESYFQTGVKFNLAVWTCLEEFCRVSVLHDWERRPRHPVQVISC